jgi:two-component system response regulator HydG
VPSLCESELFGHVKGAFTGASESRVGRFELASRGTLFLDEIGNVEPAMQSKLLRVIQEREITRVGSGEPVKVDVRIIAATNQDLSAALRSGAFREDLYYRLSVVQILSPPLCARSEDIPLLSERLVRRLSDRKHLAPRRISPLAQQVLQAYAWPGNVRELENALERALLLAQGAEIQPEDLDLPGDRSKPSPATDCEDLRLETLEALQIRKVMEIAGGRVGQAASLLGIDRKTLYRKLREHGLRQ